MTTKAVPCQKVQQFCVCLQEVKLLSLLLQLILVWNLNYFHDTTLGLFACESIHAPHQPNNCCPCVWFECRHT